MAKALWDGSAIRALEDSVIAQWPYHYGLWSLPIDAKAGREMKEAHP